MESIGAGDVLRYVLVVLVSILVTGVVLALSPFNAEDADPGTVPRLFGVVVFYTVFLSLLVGDWYRRRQQERE